MNSSIQESNWLVTHFFCFFGSGHVPFIQLQKSYYNFENSEYMKHYMCLVLNWPCCHGAQSFLNARYKILSWCSTSPWYWLLITIFLILVMSSSSFISYMPMSNIATFCCCIFRWSDSSYYTAFNNVNPHDQLNYRQDCTARPSCQCQTLEIWY